MHAKGISETYHWKSTKKTFNTTAKKNILPDLAYKNYMIMADKVVASLT